MLTLENIDLSYAEPPVHAVDHVSLDVPTGTIVALLGESGSGKSSLLRTVAGLETASGRVILNGRDVSSVPVHERNIGMVFQSGQLFPHRSVARNIAYGLEVRKLPKPERSARVAELLELVGLPGYENRSIVTLSGGQAQRVALARTLAPRPELVLLDEPLSALDRILRTRLSAQLRTILKAVDATAIYVTHDREEALNVADLIGVMHDGRLIQLGTAEQLLANPVSETVRRLLS
ncbi:ABC transporter ATP-binding protein [Trueperella pecoris]|uniref:ABC-type quaternary amine transporter n=1 Tax=Trueperella pecoris TaxID=2733571 RepID=A0A7M1QV74_9ACTO|nr:ABC transporter ATP-binding protein [Trueperella pecoris]QOR45838.1 ABC transporter ATP-binding protein [Trueperella pecoris]QTG75668.1 ABC transporter ATP-binding protein [Trueperella pecoris]